MQTTAEAVIIGGGIIGASVQYHLARRGFHDVLLLERDEPGSGTTAYTAAWVRYQQPTELAIRLARWSLAEMGDIHAETDIGLLAMGSISVCLAGDAERETARARFQASCGVPTEILSPREIKAAAPVLNVADVGIGRFCAGDGLVDAHALLHAYLRASRPLGAKALSGVEVTGIAVERGRVVGVWTAQGLIATPVVVNAAGIHARQVGRWAGLEIPVRNQLGHILVMEPVAAIPAAMPMLEILDPVYTYIYTRGGRPEYAAGDFEDTDSFAHKPRLDRFVETHIAALTHRAPALAAAGVAACIAGIRAGSPDGWPILGPVDDIAGYHNACAMGGNGIVFAPAAGQLVADAIAGAATVPIGIEQFLLRRFDSLV